MAQPLLTLDFLDKAAPTAEATPGGEVRVTAATRTGRQRKLYIESYGCQMNFSDSEIVSSILFDEGFRYDRRPRQCRPRAAQYLLHPREGRADGADATNAN